MKDDNALISVLIFVNVNGKHLQFSDSSVSPWQILTKQRNYSVQPEVSCLCISSVFASAVLQFLALLFEQHCSLISNSKPRPQPSAPPLLSLRLHPISSPVSAPSQTPPPPYLKPRLHIISKPFSIPAQTPAVTILPQSLCPPHLQPRPPQRYSDILRRTKSFVLPLQNVSKQPPFSCPLSGRHSLSRSIPIKHAHLCGLTTLCCSIYRTRVKPFLIPNRKTPATPVPRNSVMFP